MAAAGAPPSLVGPVAMALPLRTAHAPPLLRVQPRLLDRRRRCLPTLLLLLYRKRLQLLFFLLLVFSSLVFLPLVRRRWQLHLQLSRIEDIGLATHTDRTPHSLQPLHTPPPTPGPWILITIIHSRQHHSPPFPSLTLVSRRMRDHSGMVPGLPTASALARSMYTALHDAGTTNSHHHHIHTMSR